MTSASRNSISTKAITTATATAPHVEETVVFGSVIMKSAKSWYIGPVIGATSAA
jgi:hypothetical protein